MINRDRVITPSTASYSHFPVSVDLNRGPLHSPFLIDAIFPNEIVAMPAVRLE